ncbi:hypothetical protein COCSADRAFT_77604, partial [Bipolaris sorokiniana ND90Pr]
FNFKITYRVETLNRVVDTLSRRSNLRKEDYKALYNALLKIMSNSSLKYN